MHSEALLTIVSRQNNKLIIRGADVSSSAPILTLFGSKEEVRYGKKSKCQPRQKKADGRPDHGHNHRAVDCFSDYFYPVSIGNIVGG